MRLDNALVTLCTDESGIAWFTEYSGAYGKSGKEPIFGRTGVGPLYMEARIDKWLWSARIYKTRTIAADACKNGRVTVAGVKMKPSKMIKEGDVVDVKKGPIVYSFKVLKAIQNRVGAKLVPEVMQNVTSPKQLELLEMNRISGFVDRARGTGRPTKKERRDLDDFIQPSFFGDFDDDFDFDDDDEEDGYEDL